MKKCDGIKSGLIVFVLFVLFGCVAAPKYEGASQRPPGGVAVTPPAAEGTFVGTITGGSYAKGVGFSNMNLRLEVVGDTGEKITFYVRSDSKVFDQGGTEINYLEAQRGKAKKVEIHYFTIRDGSGGDPSRSDFAYEIGHKGVATLRFLN